MALTKTQKYVLGGVGVLAGVAVVGDYVIAPLLRKGSNAPTATNTGSTTAAPTVPQVTGLSASQQGTSWVLSWQPVTVQGYNVVYNVQRLDTGASTQTSNTTYTFSGLTGPTQVQVTAMVLVGSQGVAGTGSAVYTIPAVGQLPPVVGITATATSPTTATISWQAAQGVTGAQYAIRHTDASGNPVGTNMGNVAPQVTISQTSISLSSLTAGAVLNFEVAVSVNGQLGPWSAVQALQMPQAQTGTPQTPGGLRVTGTTTSSVTIAWNAISGAAAIQVGHVTPSGVVVMTTLGGNATQYTATGLNAGFPETMAVRSSTGGTSPNYTQWPWSTWSASVTGTTQSASSGGGGGYYPPAVNTQCQGLLSQENGVASTIRWLQSQLAALNTQKNNVFMNYKGTTAGKEAALAAIQSLINATQNQINTATSQLQAISRQMQAAGCF